MAIEGFAPGEEDFGKIFDNLSELAAANKPIPADLAGPSDSVTAPAAAEPPAAIEPITAPAAIEPITAPAAIEPITAPAAIEPIVAPAPSADQSQLLERFVAAMEANKPAQPAPRPTPAQPTAVFTQEEIALLTNFEKEWPDFAKVLPILLRGNNQHTTASIMDLVGRTISPIADTIGVVSADHQYNSLRQTIPDYDAVREPVIKWALNDPSIPGYLRNAYKGVIENGDVNDIASLVGTWRQATGKQAPTAPVVKPGKELSEAAKQAVVALAPVVSKRTQVVQSGVAPDDFDGAFEHFSQPAK